MRLHRRPLATTAILLVTGCCLATPVLGQVTTTTDDPSLARQDSSWARALRSEQQFRLRHARLMRLHELAIERDDPDRAKELERLSAHLEARHARRLEIFNDRVGEQWKEHLDRIRKQHKDHAEKSHEEMRRLRRGERIEDPSGQDGNAARDRNPGGNNRFLDKHQDRHDRFMAKHQDRPERFNDKHQDRHDRFIQKHQERLERRPDGNGPDEWTSADFKERHGRVADKWQLDRRPQDRRDKGDAADRRSEQRPGSAGRGTRLPSHQEARRKATETITRENESRFFRELKAEIERDM